MEYLHLEDITAYNISDKLSDLVWNIVLNWDILSKKTIGE